MNAEDLVQLEATLKELDEKLYAMTNVTVKQGQSVNMNLKDYLKFTRMRDKIKIRISIFKTVNKLTDELD